MNTDEADTKKPRALVIVQNYRLVPNTVSDYEYQQTADPSDSFAILQVEVLQFVRHPNGSYLTIEMKSVTMDPSTDDAAASADRAAAVFLLDWQRTLIAKTKAAQTMFDPMALFAPQLLKVVYPPYYGNVAQKKKFIDAHRLDPAVLEQALKSFNVWPNPEADELICELKKLVEQAVSPAREAWCFFAFFERY